MARAAVEWCWKQRPSTVLVFLTETWEIEVCRRELASLENVCACPLHGKSSDDERSQTLPPAPHT
eukprot:5669069-Lingulodinium_polyedra.AAC.1